MGVLKVALKVFAVIIAIILVFVLVIFGLRWYNATTYPFTNSPNSQFSQSAGSYETNEQIVRIRGEYMNGFHFKPAQRKHPGVVIVHGGSEGSPNYAQAKAISEQGYEVLALFFWGQDNQVPTLANVPLDQFTEVEKWVTANIEQPKPLTVVGTSKGAEYTALLAAKGFPVDNLVNFTPGEFSYTGLDFSSQEEKPSFTLKGEAVPFASMRQGDPGSGFKLFWDFLTGYPPQYRPGYESAAQHADPSAKIDLSSFKGNALFFAGDQDQMWQGEVAATNLAAQNPKFEAKIYPGAGHAFAPGLDKAPNGWQIMLGGTAEGNAAAYEDSNKVLYDHLAQWHGNL